MAITTALRAAPASATALICCPSTLAVLPGRCQRPPGAYVVSVKPIDAPLTAITEFESVRSSALMVRVVGEQVQRLWKSRWRSRGAGVNRPAGGSPSLLRPRCWMAFRQAAARVASLQTPRRERVGKSPVRQIDPTRLRLENGNPAETQLTVLATGYAPASARQGVI